MAPSSSAENCLPKCVWINTRSTEPDELTDAEWILFSLYKVAKAPALLWVAGRPTDFLTYEVVCKGAHPGGSSSPSAWA